MAFYIPRNISPADQILFDASGNAVGIQAAGSSSQPVLGMTPAKAAAVDSLVSGEGNFTASGYRTVLFADSMTSQHYVDTTPTCS